MINNNKHDNSLKNNPSLPAYARLPINRCSLPSAILGSLSFQQHPESLKLNGVFELHQALFVKLNTLTTHKQHADYFMDYMVVHFRIHNLQDADLSEDANNKRSKADYLRICKGMAFRC